ncbi:patatin-like phospholipase family protein [Hymenobacter sp. GOD-10R]|uniref:patatin-like phospholipase family protein n=1 Tax=Hymenobacter sp. GOD-10R TaxID=3093922 RepID=UPI002D76C517|nr:patatin-like phospholipase family protein [Hymenobacter sp. GOD-10R]WRQ28848.1 patatin-like phospholipase family protein [Hymenobacter sp. GOD-10R]
MQKLYVFLTGLLLLFSRLPAAQAQKVGLVLSGGGAKGLAHVGVLKVLEKNNIPIDYIIGTSMGSVVGAMYAAGYAPSEIEKIVTNPEFQNWVSGRQLESKTFNYLNSDASPAALRVGVAIDSSLRTRITPNLINDVNLNFVLAKLLAPAGATANYDFDKLFVPFRCLAAEVFTRNQVVQRNGSLSDAVRNSMAVPLVFRPIRNPDGRYLFDGGIYNNFPTDVMKAEFAPDIIIGVNVGDVAYKKYPFQKDDELLAGTLVFLGASVADTLAVGPNGVFIQPDLEGYGSTDFDKVRELIDLGTKAAQAKLPVILRRIERRVDTLALAARRTAFQNQAPAPVFDRITVQGLKTSQNAYVRRFFQRQGRTYTIDDIEEGYYRLASDDFFRGVYPRIRYDKEQGGYTFSVDASKNNNLSAELGFVLATRPVDNIYLGLEFRYLKKFLYTTAANVSLGRFYNAGQGRFRITIPEKLPFYIEPTITYNNWSYQKTGGLLGRDIQNTLIAQSDLSATVQGGISPNYRSRVTLELGYFGNQDNYANVRTVSSGDTLDRTRFQGLTAALRFTRNSLNRKQYATGGRRAAISIRAVQGTERYTPGSTSVRTLPYSDDHHWLQFSATTEQYFPAASNKQTWGYFGEVMVSGQGLFTNYRSSLTTAPVFAPLVDSRTLFLNSYRAPRYAAAGLRFSHTIFGSLEWRSEAFVHLIYKPLAEAVNQRAITRKGFDRPRLTASSGFVYFTRLGPLAVHIIHYDDSAKRWGVFGHVGFLLFHSRSLE